MDLELVYGGKTLCPKTIIFILTATFTIGKSVDDVFAPALSNRRYVGLHTIVQSQATGQFYVQTPKNNLIML